jgi:hypothetical protein
VQNSQPRSRRSAPACGTRTIVQDTALLFADMNEAKDAVDMILDRLADEAGAT